MADVTKEIALEVSLKDSTSAGTQSAKQRLREMQKELIAMAEAGQQGTDAFRRLEQAAGELKDEIGDVNQRIKNLASDTKRIDAFVGAVQGIAAGFQIAQGAAALFGDENEDLQKAMLKVQGAIALANGVQQVANLLQKESSVMMGLNTLATKAYATVVGDATEKTRLFRLALAGLGLAGILVVLGLIAEAMGFFSKVTEDATSSQKDLKRSLEDTAGTLEYYERKLKANGATEADLAKIRRKALEAEKAELDRKLQEDVARFGVKNDKYQTALRQEIELLDIKIKEESNIINQAASTLSAAEKSRRDKANADRKAASDKAIADRIAENERIAILAAAELQAEADSVAYEKALLEQQTADFNAFAEAYFAESDAILEHDRKNAEERKAIEKAVADYKEQVVFDSVAAIGQTLSAFAGENKGLAIAALAIEKGAAIANVIVNLNKEMAANAVMAAANPANVVTAGAAGIAQLKAFNTMAKIRAGLRIAAITAAGIQAGKAITSGGEGGGAPSPAGPMPSGAGGAAAPPIFANPNTTDLSSFGNGQGQGMQPMRAYVVERDIQQTTSRVRRLSEFATLG